MRWKWGHCECSPPPPGAYACLTTDFIKSLTPPLTEPLLDHLALPTPGPLSTPISPGINASPLGRQAGGRGSRPGLGDRGSPGVGQPRRPNLPSIVCVHGCPAAPARRHPPGGLSQPNVNRPWDRPSPKTGDLCHRHCGDPDRLRSIRSTAPRPGRWSASGFPGRDSWDGFRRDPRFPH